MTATTALTPEELAARVGWPHETGMRLCGEKDIAAAIRQHSAPLEAQIAELTAERDRARDQTKRSMDLTDQAQDAAEKWKARATQAEAALSAARTDYAAVMAVIGLESIADVPQAMKELRAALSASLERERVMREALERLENANDALCATHSDKTYASMLDDGARDALLALDAARREARAVLLGVVAALVPAGRPTAPGRRGMGEGPAEELARADAMVREADAMERQASALRRQARQIRARYANWRDPALVAALNKAMDGSNGNDP